MSECFVVFGATGQVGGALVRHLLDAGHTVVAQGRTADKLDRLARHAPTDRLLTVTNVLASDDDVEAFRTAVSSFTDTVQGSIAAMGGWVDGPDLVDTPVDDWRKALDANLTSHLMAVRAVTPLLGGERPIHVVLNGIAGLEPHQGAGATCVAGAALRMLVSVLRTESAESGVRYAELFVLDNIDVADDGTALSIRQVAATLDRMLSGAEPALALVLTASGDALPLGV